MILKKAGRVDGQKWGKEDTMTILSKDEAQERGNDSREREFSSGKSLSGIHFKLLAGLAWKDAFAC